MRIYTAHLHTYEELTPEVYVCDPATVTIYEENIKARYSERTVAHAIDKIFEISGRWVAFEPMPLRWMKLDTICMKSPNQLLGAVVVSIKREKFIEAVKMYLNSDPREPIGRLPYLRYKNIDSRIGKRWEKHRRENTSQRLCYERDKGSWVK